MMIMLCHAVSAQRLGVSRRHRPERQLSKLTPNFGSWAACPRNEV